MKINIYTENNVDKNDKIGSTKYLKQINQYYSDLGHEVKFKIIEAPEFSKIDKLKSIFQLITNKIPVQIYKRRNLNILCDGDINIVENIYIAESIVNKNECVLLAQDSMSRLQISLANAEKNIAKRIYYSISTLAYYNLEKNIYNDFKKVIFVSNEDKKYVDSQFNLQNTDIMEIGIDKKELDYDENLCKNIKDKYGDYILFTGNMNYPPNRQACELLIKEIYTKINKDINLLLVGIGSEVFNNEANCVFGLGMVESLSEYIRESKAYVSPLISGSGMKNKILEAMAQEAVVIASDKSIEGINGLKDKINFIYAKDVDMFIDKINNLEMYNLSKIKSEAKQFILENQLFEVKNNKILSQFIEVENDKSIDCN
ncbi:hypothetical protein UT300012_05750 [Paraclostridium bifermentans]|uniref:glycosyltransferase family 4 protein n=1 Tax=Paraclostridium bifermentans TaxID=1490 RepID=UPI001C10DAB3|nr:glycosyltransferase [Paraclostridium bifermentans]MBS5952983.1 glycosyltransferase family 4 protein [Paraclostridium bifermentans]MBU5287504.1 glycosyltransferase family 4 protein [Paraclostridium bifermentans]